MESEQRIRYAEELATLLNASTNHLDDMEREEINQAVAAMKEDILAQYGVTAWELIERGAMRLASR